MQGIGVVGQLLGVFDVKIWRLGLLGVGFWGEEGFAEIRFAPLQSVKVQELPDVCCRAFWHLSALEALL